MKLTAIVAQFPVSLSIQNNLNVIDSVLGQTNPGDLVIFPEGSVSGYSSDITFLQQKLEFKFAESCATPNNGDGLHSMAHKLFFI